MVVDDGGRSLRIVRKYLYYLFLRYIYYVPNFLVAGGQKIGSREIPYSWKAVKHRYGTTFLQAGRTFG